MGKGFIFLCEAVGNLERYLFIGLTLPVFWLYYNPNLPIFQVRISHKVHIVKIMQTTELHSSPLISFLIFDIMMMLG